MVREYFSGARLRTCLVAGFAFPLVSRCVRSFKYQIRDFGYLLASSVCYSHHRLWSRADCLSFDLGHNSFPPWGGNFPGEMYRDYSGDIRE